MASLDLHAPVNYLMACEKADGPTPFGIACSALVTDRGHQHNENIKTGPKSVGEYEKFGDYMATIARVKAIPEVWTLIKKRSTS
ncbi:hypothetical protein CDAR_241151 [Caerostris darwini]|uniref:Uncharacterized protein n=1 Tax=Caerostris darwini TaxID=1538125 RepID=A0AAV4TIZ8_9ARAC|nr:hypothetical protein CDAR_241151 [Caerostris darwini]